MLIKTISIFVIMELLSKQLGINKNELKQALTHFSFYENKDQEKANSRLVFAGMFAFKGILADVLYKYYTGSGTELQHILGNLFKNELLNRLYQKWGLANKVRVGKKFDIKKHKHIFVYAVFGCISQSDEDTQRRFIFKHIITNDTKHIFNHVKRNKDLISQTKLIAKQSFKKQLKTEMQLTKDSLHRAIITFDDNTIICEAESKSYRYARKKAMKLALQILSNITFDKFAEETGYLEKVKKRIEKEKEQHRKEVEAKIAEKKKLQAERIALNKKIKKARDLARKKAQAEAKKHKQELARIKAEKEKNKKPLSAAKRRFLEDKKQ